MTVDSTAMLINGLQTQFSRTYTDVQNRLANSNLALVMDLDSVKATNRNHDFGYRDAAPHLEHVPRGSTMPTEGMASTTYNVVAHNWGKRLEWHEDDREDDQAQTLMDDAAATGRSAALLAEEFFFDLLTNGTDRLPTAVNAPDGLSMFNSGTRFEQSSGNTITAAAFTTSTVCLGLYYDAIARLRSFKDGKGQPLWTSDVLDQGVVLICSTGDQEVWETALKQKIGIGQAATAGTTNILHDAGHNVTLWPTLRCADDTAYVFLKNPPVKSTFLMERRGLRERSSLGDQNNSDRTRDTGMEYVQWDIRTGAGINNPYSCVRLQ